MHRLQLSFWFKLFVVFQFYARVSRLIDSRILWREKRSEKSCVKYCGRFSMICGFLRNNIFVAASQPGP